MTKGEYLPERGDIAWMILDPRVGHEQSGRRPVLIISHGLLAENAGMAVIVPITSKTKGLPYELSLKGTKTKGALLPIHVKSVDFRHRKAVFIEKLPKAQFNKALVGVINLID